jgi:hypothetical protein
MSAGGDADERARRNPLGFNDLGELDIRAQGADVLRSLTRPCPYAQAMCLMGPG